jgi:phenylpyruvate tautomerase PptA (4-oxalocrotonate tautomerase family)
MPFLRIDMAGPVDPEMKRRLLYETAQLFAEIIESDIARVRTQVHELPATDFAVGGIPIAESGIQAPFITLDLFRGRPASEHQALCERIPPLVAEIVGCPIERTRLRINEVFPEGWAIGGVQASTLRRNEIEARADRPH